jgi:hypothetical protein
MYRLPCSKSYVKGTVTDEEVCRHIVWEPETDRVRISGTR